MCMYVMHTWVSICVSSEFMYIAMCAMHAWVLVKPVYIYAMLGVHTQRRCIIVHHVGIHVHTCWVYGYTCTVIFNTHTCK